jgi:positive regulator of sigma E activity
MSDVTIGRAACEACSATWNCGTNSAVALGPRKSMENLDRVSRSQDLPDAN